MNQQLKAVLLTVLTLSVFVVAIVELSGVSSTALFNKYQIGKNDKNNDKVLDLKNVPKTTIEFDSIKFDFGKIKEGEKVRHAYKFKNTGNNLLIIADAVASCGCTVPSFPKKPIPPGEGGEILIEFNSANRAGIQKKNILVISNAQIEHYALSFVADVHEK